MTAIKTYNKIAKAGLDVFGANYRISDNESEPVGALVRSADLHNESFPESLIAIGRAGAGTNNIPIHELTERAVAVFNTPSANANAVKELTVLGLLLASRKVVLGIEWAKGLKGKGSEISALVEKGKSAFSGPELSGKALGVIGLGAIGVLVANAAYHLGMRVYGYDPYLSVQNALNLSHHITYVTDIKEIYASCDYITLHIPENPSTKNTINKETISAMRDGVRVINFARGGLVCGEDMKAALECGKVAAYVVDFPSEELLCVDGVVSIPHLGASTPESEENCAVMAAHELIDYIENGNITNSVNLPSVSMLRSGEMRICVVHRNIPNMLSAITSAVAEGGVNIENLLNKSKGEYAYTMLDVNNCEKNAVKNRIEAIDGILRVRII